MATVLISSSAIVSEELSLIVNCRAPKVRTMAEFAAQEIICPNDGGPFAGEPFDLDRQPFARLFLEALDSGQWPRFAALGPTQSGKSLLCFVIIILYYVFELKETVVIGLPTMEMANDKWQDDLLPVIKSSGFASQLMTTGEGSESDRVKTSFRFRDAGSIRFMTAGGDDKSRAGKTTRVTLFTEVDGMDTTAATSVETDKVTQIIARTGARKQHEKRIGMECTVSVESGRIWTERKNGSDTDIACQCPHCSEYVKVERDDLNGWQEAESEVQAMRDAWWCCPSCGEQITDEERIAINQADVARLVHRGQSIDSEGVITGDAPETLTFGFRWSAFNNMFLDAADYAFEEWHAARAEDKENAERKMCQFIWAVPYEPPDVSITIISADKVQNRQPVMPLTRGLVPHDAVDLSVGLDISKTAGHWTLGAWRGNRSGHITDYGSFEIESKRLGPQRATAEALGQFIDRCAAGWTWQNHGEAMRPTAIWIDVNWSDTADQVYDLCKEHDNLCRPCIGRGGTVFRVPGNAAKVGSGWYFRWDPHRYLHVVMHDTDHWKGWVHEHLTMDLTAEGSLTLFTASPREHRDFSKQITAERRILKRHKTRGLTVAWENPKNSPNHWLDSTSLACSAGSFLAQMREEEANKPKSLASWFQQSRRTG